MKRTVALLTCCSLVTLTVGCSQPVVRGQNGMPAYGQPPQMAGLNGDMMSDGMPMQMAGPHPGPMYYDGPAFGNGPACPPQADVWRPTHHHTYNYKTPKNLKYPPQNQQPAVYQYPYYTVKGPSDFFYNK